MPASYVPLAEQDTALWDARPDRRGRSAAPARQRLRRIGRYQLEAAVQSAHAARRLDRPHRLGGDRDALRRAAGAHRLAGGCGQPRGGDGRGRGRRAGLAALDAHRRRQAARDYQPYWAARAELLARPASCAEAAKAYERAIGLEPDPAVRQFLQAQARGCQQTLIGRCLSAEGRAAPHRLPATFPRNDGEKEQAGDADAPVSPSFTGRG